MTMVESMILLNKLFEEQKNRADVENSIFKCLKKFNDINQLEVSKRRIQLVKSFITGCKCVINGTTCQGKY